MKTKKELIDMIKEIKEIISIDINNGLDIFSALEDINEICDEIYN